VHIEAVELRTVRLPLRAPIRAAHGTLTDRPLVLVGVHTREATGWGECAALPEPTYSAEWVDGASAVLEHHLVPRLLAAGDLDAAGVAGALDGVAGHPMAKAAIEMAVLDVELQVAGRSLADHLGGVRPSVAAGVAVGIAASVPALLDTVAEYVAAGYRRVKLKIEPGWDVEPVRAVREQFGEAVDLQVDGNGAYSRADLDHLARLDDFALLLVEQPLPTDDLLGHAELASHVRTPVCLDESVTSVTVAATALALGACSVVCVKAPRLGGYLEAQRVHDLCLAEGVPVWCGGMYDAGLARAANRGLASLPGFTLAGDLSATDRFLLADVTPVLAVIDGMAEVPTNPGVGARVDPAALEELTDTRLVLRPAPR
jgi:O-succinylbenzoate synthase